MGYGKTEGIYWIVLKVENFLKDYELAWPSSETCNQAFSVFSRYYLTHGLGLLDAIIGHMAVALNSPLYTFNQKHYKSIPQLKTIQPYQRNE
ncbi:MAG: hypothetical protein AB1585_09280 [Thermodesulfobacteriota bacterium]